MSQPMNFSPDIKVLSGGELPPNSVTLVYSPSCPHCHNILGQYNQLPGLSGGKFSVHAVNLMDHYHSLRAGGIEVGGVPQILIRGGSSEILEYGGPRMAESIAKEAMGFLTGGERLSGGRIFGGDMLLGGSTEEVVLEGGKKKRGSRRRSRSRSRSGRRRRHMRGGAEEDLSGGKRRRRSRSRSRRMRGGEDVEIAGGEDLEGGKRRRRRSRSRSRRLGGGEAPEASGEAASELNGGRRSRAGGWIGHVTKYWHAHPGMSYGEALSKAAPSWRKSRKSRG